MRKNPISPVRDQILNAAREMTRIPILPEFAQRVLEISRTPPDDIDISNLAQLISQDAAMASRVLSVANSPYYGLNSRVTTLRQAVVIIGLNDFMSLVLASSVLGAFKSRAQLQNLDLAQFWVHSLAVGAAAKAMSTTDPIPMLCPTEINLVALLHDIGKSLFFTSFPQQFDRCIQQASARQCLLEQIEEEEFGINHASLGAIMAEEWKLPDLIIQTIRYHHSPHETPEPWRECAWLVARADNFMLTEGIGQSGNRPRTLEEMDSIKPSTSDKKPASSMLSEQNRTTILKSVEQTLKDAMNLWGIEPQFQENITETKGKEEQIFNIPSASQSSPSPINAPRTPSISAWQRLINWVQYRVLRFNNVRD